MLKSAFFRIVFISWIVFVTFSSLFSFSGVDTSSFNIPHFDKFVHFTFYFAMVLLGAFAVREKYKGEIKQSRTLFYIVVFSVLYGIIIEVIQNAFTVNREGDVWDALANTSGALIGALAVRFLFSGKWPLKWKY